MTLAQHILAVLEESPIPVRTPDLVAMCATGKTHPRGRVWSSLRILEAHQLVRRAGRQRSHDSRHRPRFWVATKWDGKRGA